MENLHNQLHEVFVLRCLRITKNFRCISSEVRELPYFDGYGSSKEFLQAFEAEVPRERRLWALNLAAQHLRGGGTHIRGRSRIGKSVGI